MQAIANEFNLAETTFVLPPDDPANTARVRIFTPRAEMPFAGHPNIGTAFVLAHQDTVCGVSFNRQSMIFEEIAGPVRMTIDSADGAIAGASLAAPQRFRVIRNFDVAMIAQACSLDPSDIEVRRHPPCLASCGAPFVIAEVRDRAALRRAQQRMDVFLSHLPRSRGHWNSFVRPGRRRRRRLSIPNVCAAAWRLRRPCDRERQRRAYRTPRSFARRNLIATGSRHWAGNRPWTTEPAAGCCGKG